ncbi:unnamed protein product [Microthlaspi erraticum]|uniref:Arabidopsis retrotransposon Orf1 C-terminal domain-containing protein n=1 Tax=Microthlaspi erraticum TaxID=1685480 RepID=A0A6D2HFD0_9BRAS|nr:unnamed protein product [Microthlaspi erraticum]
MEEAEEEEEDELPMYQEHYNALFSMDFVETKYPHDDTMRDLGIFEDVELVLKNMQLGKFFSHRMESYKELTCEFLASMKHHEFDELDRAELDQGWGLPRSEVHVLRYVHKALANTFFARKATGTINEGEVKLLTMGIKPIISRTRDGKKIRGDRAHAGNLMPLLEQLQAYKVTTYNTRHQRGRKLSVGGVITPILCAAGVQLDKRRCTPPGWMDIKFCKTNLLIEHKELDGRFQFKFTHPTAGLSKLLLPNPELTTVLGGRTLTSDPLCTLWLGMKRISCSIELRIELRFS